MNERRRVLEEERALAEEKLELSGGMRGSCMTTAGASHAAPTLPAPLAAAMAPCSRMPFMVQLRALFISRELMWASLTPCPWASTSKPETFATEATMGQVVFLTEP